MLMNMSGRDEIQRLAAVLERPRTGYAKRLEQAQRAAIASSDEASRQLRVFVERIADLTLEELCELYDETFRADQAEIEALVRRLVREHTSHLEAATALGTLAPLLDRLEYERNPHAYVVRSLCCLLLHRLDQSRVQGGLRRSE